MWDIRSVIFCSSGILMLPGICCIYFSNPFFISPRAPITIRIVVAFIPQILSISISRSLYLSTRPADRTFERFCLHVTNKHTQRYETWLAQSQDDMSQSNVKCNKFYKCLKLISYSPTIIAKNVGKVALFTSSFPSSPLPWPKLIKTLMIVHVIILLYPNIE